MPLYHLLLDAAEFHERIHPTLSAARRSRSLEPCKDLCTALLPTAREFAQRYCLGPEEPLLAEVARGLAFERDFWPHLVGEVLWYSAAEIPELQTAPDTLCCLLAPERYRHRGAERGEFSLIEQAHHGARDLIFGGACYRPEQAGYNDLADVERVAVYLESLDPHSWTVAGLASLAGTDSDEDRAEELEFVRDWFPALRDLYRRARDQRQVVVCEIV
jgi:hypothetical protein